MNDKHQTEYGRAFNARSTRPLWHYFKAADLKDGPSVIKALCGAQTRWDLADGAVGHLPGCAGCDKKYRNLGAKAP